MAVTDPYPIFDDEGEPLTDMWWLDGNAMVVEVDGQQMEWGPIWAWAAAGRLGEMARKARVRMLQMKTD